MHLPQFVHQTRHPPNSIDSGSQDFLPTECHPMAQPIELPASSRTPSVRTGIANHKRVRTTSRAKGRVAIEPVLPLDLLGAYVLLPLLSALREPT